MCSGNTRALLPALLQDVMPVLCVTVELLLPVDAA
jgi:hypothetical protein